MRRKVFWQMIASILLTGSVLAEPVGLVLSGGGAKGAYGSDGGVWDCR